jgi:NAD(P)-dependent dehydrogenase (short-subunit alcohol dehydrogenase family)
MSNIASSNSQLDGRLILITGASRGIGKAAAIACAAAGAELIITGRTSGALEEVDDEIRAVGSSATIVELDQTDYAATPRLADAIANRWGRLDGFVANAGQLGQMAPMAHIEPDIWERTLSVNLTSIWFQAKTFDPLLRAAPAGRVVLVSSGAAVGARPFWGAYAVSKAGLESMALAWAAENEQTNMKINLLDPGGTATAMRASAYPGEDPATLPSPADIAPAFVTLLSDSCEGHGERYSARALTGL